MTNPDLKQVIRELGDELGFLSEDQIAEVITDMIVDLLPLAILSMEDDSMEIDDSKLTKEEYHERRRWGKERQEVEEMIAHRRELLDHLRTVKSSTENLRTVDHGSLLMIAPQSAMAFAPLIRQSSNNIAIEYPPENYSSESLEKKYYSPRGRIIQFAVDNSLLNKLNNNLFAKFCSTIERTARYFAMTRTNEFVFTLKERKDVELPDWQRTVLFVRFPKIRFATTDMFWSTLSNETRNDLNKTLKQLTIEEQEHFRNFIENFNVEMDY